MAPLTVLRAHPIVATRLTFTLLVVLVPLWFGLWWVDHQRSEQTATLVRERRQLLIDSCERGNVVRARLTVLVEADREQADLLIDYMRLDIATSSPTLTAAEKIALRRLLILYRSTVHTQPLPQVDCEKVIH